jgi:hypothetical protein
MLKGLKLGEGKSSVTEQMQQLQMASKRQWKFASSTHASCCKLNAGNRGLNENFEH